MNNVTIQQVKELRQLTGAGMMDCKTALEATEGAINKATEWLRQKGINTDKPTTRNTQEGLIGSYIHTGGRVGILAEVNCETDFVARNEEFKSLVQSICMQIAACPNVDYISLAHIPSDVIDKERQIEMGRDDLSKKPENIKEKIVQGRIEKCLKEMSLLDQPYIRDQSITLGEYIKTKEALLGESIKVKRFSRFTLGE